MNKLELKGKVGGLQKYLKPFGSTNEQLVTHYQINPMINLDWNSSLIT
jgi:hypothetical protein